MESHCLQCKSPMPGKNRMGKDRKYCNQKCANAYYNEHRKEPYTEEELTKIDRLQQMNQDLSAFVSNLSDRWELLYEVGNQEVQSLMDFIGRQFPTVIRLPR